MSVADPADLPEAPLGQPAVTLEKVRRLISRCDPWFRVLGLAWLTPICRVIVDDNPSGQIKEIWRLAVVPVLSITAFLMLWATLAPITQASLGAIPGPAQVWEQVSVLRADAAVEAQKAQDFYVKQHEKNAAAVAAGKPEEVKNRTYVSKPTFPGQILIAIKTVFLGFLIGTVIAVPLGILCGLSATAHAAIKPPVQSFKPVSLLAWLPIVTMIVSATVGEGGLPKSFIVSAVTVTLCFVVGDADQQHTWRGLDRQGPGQRGPRSVAEPVDAAHQAGAALCLAADLHRAAAVFGRWLDGADRRRDAGAEPRP